MDKTVKQLYLRQKGVKNDNADRKQYNAICAMAKDKVVLSAGSVRSGKTVAVCFALPVLVVRHRGQEGTKYHMHKNIEKTRR